MINRVILVGRLTKDPEMRGTLSGKKVCSFTLAVSKPGKDAGADFIGCIAWGKTAELIAQYLHKGSQLGVEGRIQTRNYEDPNTFKKVYVTEVLVNDITFLDSKSEQPKVEIEDEPLIDITDDDLPF